MRLVRTQVPLVSPRVEATVAFVPPAPDAQMQFVEWLDDGALVTWLLPDLPGLTAEDIRRQRHGG